MDASLKSRNSGSNSSGSSGYGGKPSALTNSSNNAPIQQTKHVKDKNHKKKKLTPISQTEVTEIKPPKTAVTDKSIADNENAPDISIIVPNSVAQQSTTIETQVVTIPENAPLLMSVDNKFSSTVPDVEKQPIASSTLLEKIAETPGEDTTSQTPPNINEDVRIVDYAFI
ncbi:period circadian protein-like [Ctenocephalides felis]|uniref:period circadian protein-like n=1 Tax=Ctenocephalides felis TaxID=7515 RepID=UPI000E6E2E59|nr:period circadian protein-like [Ctenocephalides felis]